MAYQSIAFDPTKYISDVFSNYASMAQSAVIDYLWSLPASQAEEFTQSTFGDMLAEKMNKDLITNAEDALQVCDPLSPGYIFSTHWKDVLQADSTAIKHSLMSKGIGFAETIAEGYAASILLAGVQSIAPQSLVGMMPGGIFAQALSYGGPLACSILIYSARKLALGDTVAENFRLHNYSRFENPFGVEAIRQGDLDRYPEVSARLKNAQENINALAEPMAENIFQIEKCFQLLKDKQFKAKQQKRIDNKLQSEINNYETHINNYNAAIIDVRDGFELLEKLNKAQFKAKAKDYESVKNNLSNAEADILVLTDNLNLYKERYQTYKQEKMQDQTPSVEQRRAIQFSTAENSSQPMNSASTTVNDTENNVRVSRRRRP